MRAERAITDDGEDYRARVDLTDEGPAIIGQLLWLFAADGAAWSEVLVWLNSGNPRRRELAVETILERARAAGTLVVELDPDEAELVAARIDDARLEPDRCRYAGGHNAPGDCPRYAEPGLDTCAQHVDPREVVEP